MAKTINAAQDDVQRNITPGQGVLWRMLSMFKLTSHPYLPPDDDERHELKKLEEWWEQQFKMSATRQERYRLFREMDEFGLVQSVLDAMAEEATQPDYDRQRSVWIDSTDVQMVKAGEACLANCAVEDKINPIVRRAALLGDEFRRLVYQTGKGVLGWKACPAEKVHRKEDKFDRLVGFMQDGKKFRAPRGHSVSWPWDYVHFRLLGKDEGTMYGTSAAMPLFRPWRQLVLSEDAVLMYRLRRAPDRNLIFVDVGDMEEHEASTFVSAWRKRFRKFEFIDPASPDYRKQYNPLTPLEDIFWPVRGSEQNSRVESLTGVGNMGDLFDLEHFRDKFFGAARAPKAYFGFEGEINAKATLMQQDVRWARTLKRIQKMGVYGLRNLLDIHYTLLHTSDKDDKFDINKHPYLLMMSPISYLDEWERLELLQLRVQVVESMSRWAADMQMNPRVWSTYLLLNYAKLPEDLVLKLIAKAPKEPPPPMAGGFEDVPPDDRPRLVEAFQRQRTQKWLAETDEEWVKGYYGISPKEERMIAAAMHGDPKLRKIVGDFAEVMMEDIVERQTDPSVLPPRYPDPKNAKAVIILEDNYEDDSEAKTLKEDLEALRLGTLKAKEKEKDDVPAGEAQPAEAH